jgi:hypothetical protein
VKRRELLIAGGLAAVLLVAAAVLVVRASRAHTFAPQKVSARATSSAAPPTLADPKWAKGQRITVEVLNATKVRGLARRAARALRDQGFDVVSTGTNHDQFDSTKVLDRTGHRDWAELAAKAMGGGTVLVRPDSSREVDLTVLIGSTWRAPSQPFYP